METTLQCPFLGDWEEILFEKKRLGRGGRDGEGGAAATRRLLGPGDGRRANREEGHLGEEKAISLFSQASGSPRGEEI